MIAYITYNDLVNDVRQNLWKIPRVDLVIFVPRSGILPAGIITKFLNVNMMSINKFCQIVETSENVSEDILKELFKSPTSIVFQGFVPKNILVVDDTIYSGRQMNQWRARLSKDCYKDFNFTFMALYKEGIGVPDLYLKDVTDLATQSIFNSVLYEWTIFNRRDLMPYFGFDMDGVICVNPPDDQYREEYENYIANPIPLYTPVTGEYQTTIITYRIEPYKDVTSKFIESRGIRGVVYMVNAQSREERNALISPWKYKAEVLNSLPRIQLYIESNDFEAQLIHQLWGKPVLCIETNKLYDN